jgi:hypothetical protein
MHQTCTFALWRKHRNWTHDVVGCLSVSSHDSFQKRLNTRQENSVLRVYIDNRLINFNLFQVSPCTIYQYCNILGHDNVWLLTFMRNILLPYLPISKSRREISNSIKRFTYCYMHTRNTELVNVCKPCSYLSVTRDWYNSNRSNQRLVQ